MYTARCTPRVLEALHLPGAERAEDPSAALGDWYVDFIQTRRHRLVHFVSDRSLLSVVVSVKTLSTALDRHVSSLGSLLEALGVNLAVVEAEMVEMAQRELANTNSQIVLASIHDLATNARSMLERTPLITPAELSLQLCQVPFELLGMRAPAEAAMALLLERHSGRPAGVRGA
jgi:hypothetical protein